MVERGSGPIVLYQVACTGVEPRLFDCPNSGPEVNYCSQSYDTGVVCQPGKENAVETLLVDS